MLTQMQNAKHSSGGGGESRRGPVCYDEVEVNTAGWSTQAESVHQVPASTHPIRGSAIHYGLVHHRKQCRIRCPLRQGAIALK